MRFRSLMTVVVTGSVVLGGSLETGGSDAWAAKPKAPKDRMTFTSPDSTDFVGVKKGRSQAAPDALYTPSRKDPDSDFVFASSLGVIGEMRAGAKDQRSMSLRIRNFDPRKASYPVSFEATGFDLEVIYRTISQSGSDFTTTGEWNSTDTLPFIVTLNSYRKSHLEGEFHGTLEDDSSDPVTPPCNVVDDKFAVKVQIGKR